MIVAYLIHGTSFLAFGADAYVLEQLLERSQTFTPEESSGNEDVVQLELKAFINAYLQAENEIEIMHFY